ncbi:MAG: TonB-dependent receptor, partial [Bacteroidota bacterium]
TNGSVDVAYSDAETGARDIKMLGLRGLYTQLMVEKRPGLGGLGAPFALQYLPGTWIEGIQISKGAGSVQNGYNSIAGQINTELVKPWKDHLLFVNLYGNTTARGEANIHFNKAINDEWSTSILFHANINRNSQDRDPDGFHDLPQKQMLNGLYRLFYRGEYFRAQFNVHAIQDERFGGQISNPQLPPTGLYQVSQQARRLEAYGKAGYLGFKNPNQSIGAIWSLGYHETNDFFGDRIHRGDQMSGYFNLIFTTPIGNEDHMLNMGASYVHDDYREELDDLLIDRLEQVPGVFAEYTFSPENAAGSWWRRWNAVLGMRVDFHNLAGTLYSPRANLKYNINDDMVFRISGGRGYRMANPIAENLGLLVSNRTIRLEDNLPMEQAWNYGVNYVYNFKILGRDLSFNVDAYRTDFVDQVMVDREYSPTLVWFYRLNGKSFANSLLTMLQVSPVDGLDMKFVYKFTDVQMDFLHGFHDMPLVVRHRGLFTADYETPNEKWMFNLSTPIVGSARLPDNSLVPDELLENHPTYSPVYA